MADPSEGILLERSKSLANLGQILMESSLCYLHYN